MDLDLDIAPRTRGRAAKQIAAFHDRDLGPADLATLSSERGTRPSALVKIRDRHHLLARLIAAGQTVQACAAVTGYTVSRISILKDDPAFEELIGFYKDQVDEKYFDMHEQLAGLSADALAELRDRLEDEPDAFSTGQLLDILTKTADRVGFGPSAKTEVSVNIGIASRMDAARQRMKTINAVPELDFE